MRLQDDRRSGANWRITALSLLLGCISFPAIDRGADTKKETGGGPSPLNALAESEKADGWRLLFDGKTPQGWRGFRRQEFPSHCWAIEEGCLRRLPPQGSETAGSCGDIITVENFGNFELKFEWCISTGSNSGVKYLISEDRPPSWERAYFEYHYADLQREARETGDASILTPDRFKYTPMGFEFQLIDDRGNEDAFSGPMRITGALYDLLGPSQSPGRPAGQFNQARILVRGMHVEHWVNGVKVLEFERNSQKLRDRIAQSKFANLEGFGMLKQGHIALQDHDGEVRFRNIKIRELKAGN